MAAVTEMGGNSSTSVSGAQRFFARAMFIFFGKPLLFLLPALIITGAGVYMASSEPSQYQSVGVLSISSETFLDTLSGTRSDTRSFETPALTTARQFNELMQTDGFAASVIDGAGLGEQRANGSLTLLDVRQNTYASAAGDTIVEVIAVASEPEWARQLAVSGIATFKNFVISSEASGTDVAEIFYDEQLTTYKLEVDAASAALQAYLAAHPEPIDPDDERDIGEQLEIAKLDDLLARAQARFDSAFDNREAARLATLQSSADINQRFRTLDEPSVPEASLSGLKTMLTTVVLFSVLGLLVSLAAVVLVSVIDRSVYSASDLDVLGANVLAVVPRTSAMKIDHARRLKPVPSSTDVPMRSAG